MGEPLAFMNPSITPWNNPGQFHFPETMELPSNFTPRVVSTPNRAKTKHHWLHTHTHARTHTNTLNYATSLVVALRRSSRIPGVAKGNIGLISLPHST